MRRIYGSESFEHTFERLIPDLTFREAMEISGRHISISVSPCERHHSPRLLNAITSPHVLIRSAVRASCAVPGLFEPVQLLARNARGKVVPYLKSRWVDGIFAADLPAKQLARLYGTNHYIVSYINPMLLPVFRDHKVEGRKIPTGGQHDEGFGTQPSQGVRITDGQVPVTFVERGTREQVDARHSVPGLRRRRQHCAGAPNDVTAEAGVSKHI
jgi:predicted acylesterase/phospholipase RssA